MRLVKAGFFLLGVMTTILVGYVTAPIWFFRSEREELYRDNIKRYDNEIVVVVGSGRRPKPEETNDWKLHSVSQTTDSADWPENKSNWHEHYFLTLRSGLDAVKVRNKIIDAIDNALREINKD